MAFFLIFQFQHFFIAFLGFSSFPQLSKGLFRFPPILNCVFRFPPHFPILLGLRDLKMAFYGFRHRCFFRFSAEFSGFSGFPWLFKAFPSFCQKYYRPSYKHENMKRYTYKPTKFSLSHIWRYLAITTICCGVEMWNYWWRNTMGIQNTLSYHQFTCGKCSKFDQSQIKMLVFQSLNLTTRNINLKYFWLISILNFSHYFPMGMVTQITVMQITKSSWKLPSQYLSFSFNNILQECIGGNVEYKKKPFVMLNWLWNCQCPLRSH